MERIELFDSYIKNQLSSAQRKEFEARLKSDSDFASEFNVYLLAVDGICREAHQDNMDFGKAMKSLSKEDLKAIIGKQTDPNKDADNENNIRTGHKTSSFRFKAWVWQAASIAAILIIACTIVFNIERKANVSVDNAIYACAEINPDLVRAGGEEIDIKTLNEEELRKSLPEIKSIYEASSSLDEVADNGFALAMAYLRLHDRDNVKAVLNELVGKFQNDPEYAGYVGKWQEILAILE